MGSGPYRYKVGDIPQLESNPYARVKPNLEPIYLVASEDDSTAINGLDSGTYSFVYSDLSGGEVPRTSGANLRVPLNYLVFLGINAQKADFAKSGVRLAISARFKPEYAGQRRLFRLGHGSSIAVSGAVDAGFRDKRMVRGGKYCCSGCTFERCGV